MPERRIATVLMLDVVGSTDVAAQLGDARYRELSSRFNRIVRAALKRFGGREEDHAGDGFFATFPQPDRAIRCSAALVEDVQMLGIEIRCGIHTGQTESQEGKTHGIAVVIGARVMSLAGAGDILVTSTTKELVTGSGFGFEDLSAHELKGVPGTWQVFALTAVDGAEREGPLGGSEAAERRAAIQPTAPPRRPRRVALIAGAGAGAVAIGIVVFALRASLAPGRTGTTPTESPRYASGTVVQLDPESGEALASIHAPIRTSYQAGGPGPVSNHVMVVGQGGVWVASVPHFLVHIDPVDRDVRKELTLPDGFSFSINVAEGAEAIWAADQRGLVRVRPATDELRMVLDLEGNLTTVDVAVGAGAVWVGVGDGRLIRYDPDSERARSVDGLDPIDEVAIGFGSVWTVDVLGSTVMRYDPGTMEPIEAIPIAGGVDAVGVGSTDLWALSRTLGSLTEIDPDTNSVDHIVQVGEAPTVLTAGFGAIWVADRDGTIRRIDEATRQWTEIDFGAEVRALAIDNDTDTLWIDVA